MAQITYFFLSKCIYCSKADRMIRLVKEKHPEFKEIKIQKIEESLKPEIADQYDYQLVPCFFVGDKKIPGVIGTKAVHLQSAEERKSVVSQNV